MKRILPVLVFVLFLAGCDTVDLYERGVAIPGHAWKSSFKPSFTFTIKDTTAPYDLYVIFRHSARYHYNNVWVNLGIRTPDGKQTSNQFELPLAGKKGEDGNPEWLGSGMDDIYEHYILLRDANPQNRYLKAGTYTFTLEHMMRENPLDEVYNVGLRVAKKQR